jgi:hypothetical protein
MSFLLGVGEISEAKRTPKSTAAEIHSQLGDVVHAF